MMRLCCGGRATSSGRIYIDLAQEPPGLNVLRRRRFSNKTKGRLKRKEVNREDRSRGKRVMTESGDAVSHFANLPTYLQDEIIRRLERADDVARTQSVSRSFRDSCQRITSLRIVCTIKFHDEAREGCEQGSLDAGNPHGEGKSDTSDTQDARECEGGGSTNVQIVPAQQQREPVLFRDLVVVVLKNHRHLEQLRIEIDSKLQAKVVPEGERRRTDHWLSDSNHVSKWIHFVQDTLKHLCIVDYGQQAIMRRTSILKVLSDNCKVLQSLDLRNMSIDTENCKNMTSLTSLTLRCVKVNSHALQDINDHMPKLKSLALLGVFGMTHGKLDFPEMEVLCLGLSTQAKEVAIKLPVLIKLQLKMQCPENLSIDAPTLKFIAFNLELQNGTRLDVKNVRSLQELLYGASSFTTLLSLVKTNLDIDKVFLDIPCMALGEDGKWLGVLKDVPLDLPDFSQLHERKKLDVLNVGPGLWYSMEVNVDRLERVEKWPPYTKLILHMIPQRLYTCERVLRCLLKPNVTTLQVYVHTSSPIEYQLIIPKVAEILSHHQGPDCMFKPNPWTKSLDFSCFSF